MRKIVIIFVVFVAVFLAWNYPRFTKTPLACEEPIAYAVGAFDRRFGISHKDFLDAIVQAEAVWEKPSGIELFAYKPESGELAINLVYDYRQEVTGTLSSLENVVADNEATYNTLKTRYDGLKAEYNNAESIYDARVKMFNEKSDAYQKQVESWNRGQRNSRKQFDQLEINRVALEAEAAALKVLETQLNGMAREINGLVGTLNYLANSLNLNVASYNTIGASRGETFTGGTYYTAEEGRSIDIYEFSSREKLVRIMAHELGHALGLEHGTDPEAIMYYLNEGEAEVLTATDLAALQTLCYTKDIKN
ncbi:MAG: matrixin family metalloprotease [bacterium]|nr:matrixin family metalloprotease [bacterium]